MLHDTYNLFLLTEPLRLLAANCLESVGVPFVSEYVHTTKLLTEQEIHKTCTIQIQKIVAKG